MVVDRLRPAPAVKLFIAVMSGQEQYQNNVEDKLVASFGPIQRRSSVFSFSEFSHYYDDELGSPVWKYFISFHRLIQADELVPVKLATETLQHTYAVKQNDELHRSVNLDPGYVTGWNVVLSTVKNHGHRLYLREGVFAEVTLLYRNRSFQPLPWTYSDYSSTDILEFLELVRRDWLADCRDG